MRVSGDRLWKRHVDHIKREMNNSPWQEEVGTAPEQPLPVPISLHVEELQASAQMVDVKTFEIQPADLQTPTTSSPTSHATKRMVKHTPVSTPPAGSHALLINPPYLLHAPTVKQRYPLRDRANHRHK